MASASTIVCLDQFSVTYLDMSLLKRIDRLPNIFGRRARVDSFVFVVTYGRSGSTLLQNVLNTIPGYLIRGENRGMVRDLYRFHKKSIKERRRLSKQSPLPETHPWYGIDGYPDDAAYEQMRELVTKTLFRPNANTRVCGFKEIRWNFNDLQDYLEFYQEVFPGARFIFNTRCLEDVSESKWWSRDPDALDKLKHIEAQLLDARNWLGDAAYHVHYDDYCRDNRQLTGLFDWLGERFDADAVERTFGTRHSY